MSTKASKRSTKVAELAVSEGVRKRPAAFVAVGSEDVLQEIKETEPKLMKELQAVRGALAQRGLGNGKIRPTSVATDAQLAFLAKKKPAGLRGLRRVPGFGPSTGKMGGRAKHYGKELLAALQDAQAGRYGATRKRVLREKKIADKKLVKEAKIANKEMFEALKGARKAGMIAERTRAGGNPHYPAYVVATDVDLARVALHSDSWTTSPATIKELRTINKFGPATGKPAEKIRIAGQLIVDAINDTRVSK